MLVKENMKNVYTYNIQNCTKAGDTILLYYGDHLSPNLLLLIFTHYFCRAISCRLLAYNICKVRTYMYICTPIFFE